MAGHQRVDASLLDVAPNPLTMLRRRWDPFYVIHHQIGLRPGGTLITSNGIALWDAPSSPASGWSINPTAALSFGRSIDLCEPAALRFVLCTSAWEKALPQGVEPGQVSTARCGRPVT